MDNMIFSSADLEQITRHGLTPSQVERQIKDFETGFPYLPVTGAAVVGNGIIRLTTDEVERYCELYDKQASELKVVKFVPASGAATRMFKELFEFIGHGKQSKTVDETLAGLERFAFWGELHKILGGDRNPERVIGAIVRRGLDYGAQPKALIQFHRYPDSSRTAAEEHLAEGAMYAAQQGRVRIHFTVSGEHLDGFRDLFSVVLPRYESMYGVKYDITYSQQKPSTDTIAVNADNTPFRETDGRLLFRPAGHGALISNLNDIQADLIFVKNIDNVAPDRLKPDTVTYKKALGGLLVELQQGVFDMHRRLLAGDAYVEEAAGLVENNLSLRLPANFGEQSEEARRDYLLRVLDRPIRVCGVVKNEGEPGGGPFWVADADGSQSLQIAESSQIAPEKRNLMRDATHFNPVDLVCGVKNYKGEKYDLPRFVDPATGFISEKSKDGRTLKALEVPGLWNGAMARWNTIFVETPIATFSPVKVVTDLLRPQHQ